MAAPASAVNVDDEDEEELLDEEQLDEYRDMLDALGEHPDRVKINSLSMVAEDYSDSKPAANAIYQVIRDRLLKSPREKLLPLVYAIDSILKNAKGHYTAVVEQDAGNWIPLVYGQLQEPQKAKLEKVWKTWNDARIFSPESLKAMGQCFDENVSGKSLSTSMAPVAGINRTKDGSLILPRALREEMENTLEDMQKDVPEREKVSLERIADMNPSLLAQIKEAAQASVSTSSATNGTGAGNTSNENDSGLPDYFTETRSPASIEHSKAWKAHTMNTFQEAKDATDAISEQIQQIYQGRFTQSEALDMTQYTGTASAVGVFLTKVVETMKKEEEAEKAKRNILAQGSSGFHVDASLFSNDGVKQKNTAVVGSLYEVGLPFQSSADGRRFRTQLELSKHLDALFRRAQLEKSISRAEERGWYFSDAVWQGDADEPSITVGADASASDPVASAADDGYDPETSTMPADESRDRCAICGLNFKMFFDNEDGIYKYKNCREIEVELDEVALDDSESKFIHITCWRALGSPDDLTMDQVLQDNVHH